MLNEYVYCPRLCYLEFIQGEWADSHDTLEGHEVHKNVDQRKGKVAEEEFRATSVTMESPILGITCKIDVLEGEEGTAVPIDFKKGDAPNIPEGAWEPDRVQLCAYMMTLRENGSECTGGYVYYAASKKKVWIDYSEALAEKTKEIISSVQMMMGEGRIPNPLVNNRKCEGCSLASICMPDEINALNGETYELRRLYPARDDAVHVYVIGDGASVGIKEGRLVVTKPDGVNSIPLNDISQLSLYGNVRLSSPAVSELIDRGIPILHFSYGGWFKGYTSGLVHKNVGLRMAQYGTATNRQTSLVIARRMISGKIRNCRTLLRRNDKDTDNEALDRLSYLADASEITDTVES